MFIAPAIFEMTSISNAPVWELAIASVPICTLTLTMLLLARLFIVRRAFLSPTNVFLRILKWLDAFFTKLNDNRITKGRVLLADTLPLNTITDPVAWRETTKSTLGSLRYLIRLFILMEAPIVTIGLLLIMANGSHIPLTLMLMLLWVVVALIVAVKATTLIAGERSRETLDVLLTTPLRSSEIVKQKFRGVTRLMWVLAVPLLTCVLLKVAIVQVGTGNDPYGNSARRGGWVVYLVCAVLEIGIYLPLVAWLSLFIGIRIRSQSKAIFATLATLVAWCVLPVFFVMLMFEALGWHGSGQLFCLASPAAIIPFNEFFDLDEFLARPMGVSSRSARATAEWVAVILNFTVYGAIMFAIRSLCLTDLDRRLGRSSGDSF